MSTKARGGIRVAKGLLSLLDENAAEDFEAAEAILGGKKEMVTVLQLLRKLKGGEEESPLSPEQPPLTIERLYEIVRRELLDLQISVRDFSKIAHLTFPIGLRTPPGIKIKVEDAVNSFLQQIETEIASPSEQVDALTALLVNSASIAGPEQSAKIGQLLRDLATQALTENIALFPTTHTLAQLRIAWANAPFFLAPKESRQHVINRLCDDAQHLKPNAYLKILRDLLREGLRGPADSAITAIRKMNRKNANGEG